MTTEDSKALLRFHIEEAGGPVGRRGQDSIAFSGSTLPAYLDCTRPRARASRGEDGGPHQACNVPPLPASPQAGNASPERMACVSREGPAVAERVASGAGQGSYIGPTSYRPTATKSNPQASEASTCPCAPSIGDRKDLCRRAAV